jgi:formyltetrahydrofolate synthetase
VPTDLEIARHAELLPITAIAAEMGIEERFLKHCGSPPARHFRVQRLRLAAGLRREDPPFHRLRPLPERRPGRLAPAGAGGAGFRRAGFVYPICGDMRTMPGLGSSPAAERIDIDENGEIVGLP